MSGTSSPRRAFTAIALAAAAALALSACATPNANDLAATHVGEDATPQHLADQTQTALRLARASRQAGDYASAISLYRSVLAAKPNPAIQIELGDTLLEAGFIDDAIDVFDQVGSSSTMAASALVGLTRAHLALSQPAKALTYADKAYALAPQDASVLVARGVTLDLVGRHADAQKCYRAVLAAKPRDVAARNDLALSLAMTKQFDEAIEIMTPIALSADATPRMRQNLALIYGLQGNDKSAATLSRRDLDAATTEANLRFFDFVRSEMN
jgi:Flp pilus assembly protein TadD